MGSKDRDRDRERTRDKDKEQQPQLSKQPHHQGDSRDKEREPQRPLREKKNSHYYLKTFGGEYKKTPWTEYTVEKTQLELDGAVEKVQQLANALKEWEAKHQEDQTLLEQKEKNFKKLEEKYSRLLEKVAVEIAQNAKLDEIDGKEEEWVCKLLDSNADKDAKKKKKSNNSVGGSLSKKLSSSSKKFPSKRSKSKGEDVRKSKGALKEKDSIKG